MAVLAETAQVDEGTPATSVSVGATDASSFSSPNRPRTPTKAFTLNSLTTTITTVAQTSAENADQLLSGLPLLSPTSTDETLAMVQKSVTKRFVSFRARPSQLDHETLDPFRGFFTLFWMAMALYVIQTIAYNFESVGTWAQFEFARLFSRDAAGLATSDAYMVAATFFSVVWQKVIARGWVRWRYTGMVVQHLYQLFFLGFATYWTYHRDWPWVQSGFFVLHTISMLMKIHSYAFLNGDLSSVVVRLASLRREYKRALGKAKKLQDHDDAQTQSETPVDESASSNSSSSGDDYFTSKIEKRLEKLRQEIADSEKTLKSSSEAVQYPNNVTFGNFLDFLLVPTLVYELEYPRAEKIRLRYLFEKSCATLGTFFLLYMNTETYIVPVLPTASSMPVWKLLLKMSFPFMVNYLLIFYIIFECICNVFAELTRFADRNFYDDWWNSVSWDEFARKWNKPVHHFLLRHVYQTSINSYKLSRRDATFMTFFLSSLVHELVLVVVSRKIRMYMFLLQMFQLPLIWVGNMRVIKDRRWVGNAFFWFSMFCGPPMLGILYCNEVWSA